MRGLSLLTNTVLPHSARFNLRRVAFGGGAVTCVLCGNKVREFRSHGGGAEVLDRRQVVGGMRRDDDRSPVCHGRDRTRLMMLWLDTQRPVGTKPLRVLQSRPISAVISG